MIKNEKNSKLRVFFGWCHCQRVDIDVRLLMQMFQKPLGSGGPQNSQKWPKMAKNDLIRLLHSKPPQIPKNGGIAQ